MYANVKVLPKCFSKMVSMALFFKYLYKMKMLHTHFGAKKVKTTF